MANGQAPSPQNRQWQSLGTHSLTPVDDKRRVELQLRLPRVNCELFYHYGDLDCTPMRNATYRATLANGEVRTGTLDNNGKAMLAAVPHGPVDIEYQYDKPSDDDEPIIQAREELRQALAGIVAQTRIDLADEWSEWEKANALTKELLKIGNRMQGDLLGAWDWASGTVEAVWQLAVLVGTVGKELEEWRWLMLTADIPGLDKKIQTYRAQGETIVEAASEMKELLMLIATDQKTRDALTLFVGDWWKAIPPDEAEEIKHRYGSQIILDVVIGVLLAAVSAGVAGAVWSSAKWSHRVSKLGAKLVKLLERLKDAFQNLGKALRNRKRRHHERKMPSPAQQVESAWVAARLAKLMPFKLKAIEQRWHGEHLPGNWQFENMKPPGVVRYLNEAERAPYKLTIRDGKVYDANGKPFDTSKLETLHEGGEGKAIFVMDKDGAIYASGHEYGKFHHSSFLAGQPVAAAGEMSVKNGVIKELSDKSGHYRPRAEHTEQIWKVLEALDVKTSSIKRETWGR